jgi:hypothetical protein
MWGEMRTPSIGITNTDRVWSVWRVVITNCHAGLSTYKLTWVYKCGPSDS